MADTLTPSERSERMSRIRSRDTKPELVLRKALHALGLRYRLGSRLPGKPDLVFPRYKAVVFVHGCFWHRHEGCKVATTPKSNTDFWTEKFGRNVARDARVTRELEEAGWRVFVAWECDLAGKVRPAAFAEALAGSIRGKAVGL
jgi:DNA mismatch endonuclease (patch repair protein)